MLKLVVASTNPGKLTELRSLLPSGIQLLTLRDVGIDLPPESGQTFIDNAVLKAQHASRSGLPALADDSGLEVEGLDHAPGVHSARFAGRGATDFDNNRKLMNLLAERPGASRRAWFRCVVVLAVPEMDPVWGCGQVEGRIVQPPRGSNGFGYDPHFELRDPDAHALNGRTMAELPLDYKSFVSHRARAFHALTNDIRHRSHQHKLFRLIAEQRPSGGFST